MTVSVDILSLLFSLSPIFTNIATISSNAAAHKILQPLVRQHEKRAIKGLETNLLVTRVGSKSCKV